MKHSEHSFNLIFSIIPWLCVRSILLPASFVNFISKLSADMEFWESPGGLGRTPEYRHPVKSPISSKGDI